MIKDEDQPWTENYSSLQAWLDKHEARCAVQLPNGNCMIEIWLFPKSNRVAVILVRSHKIGWEILTSADTNRIDATFEDAEKRLGLRSPHEENEE